MLERSTVSILHHEQLDLSELHRTGQQSESSLINTPPPPYNPPAWGKWAILWWSWQGLWYRDEREVVGRRWTKGWPSILVALPIDIISCKLILLCWFPCWLTSSDMFLIHLLCNGRQCLAHITPAGTVSGHRGGAMYKLQWINPVLMEPSFLAKNSPFFLPVSSSIGKCCKPRHGIISLVRSCQPWGPPSTLFYSTRGLFGYFFQNHKAPKKIHPVDFFF